MKYECFVYPLFWVVWPHCTSNRLYWFIQVHLVILSYMYSLLGKWIDQIIHSNNEIYVLSLFFIKLWTMYCLYEFICHCHRNHIKCGHERKKGVALSSQSLLSKINQTPNGNLCLTITASCRKLKKKMNETIKQNWKFINQQISRCPLGPALQYNTIQYYL